jgi:uridine kinase
MDEILAAIEDKRCHAGRAKTSPRTSLLIAIDGAGGAGKSTFAARLAEGFGDRGVGTYVVHGDDFYRPAAQRQRVRAGSMPVGADFDWPRLRDQVLLPLVRGQPARYQRYDWAADALAGWSTVASKPIVLVEGIYTFRRELRTFYELAIWIECPRAIRLARGIARDGQAARALWEREWMPAEDRYAATHQPRLAADLVVANADPYATVPDWQVGGLSPEESKDLE